MTTRPTGACLVLVTQVGSWIDRYNYLKRPKQCQRMTGTGSPLSLRMRLHRCLRSCEISHQRRLRAYSRCAHEFRWLPLVSCRAAILKRFAADCSDLPSRVARACVKHTHTPTHMHTLDSSHTFLSRTAHIIHGGFPLLFIRHWRQSTQPRTGQLSAARRHRG